MSHDVSKSVTVVGCGNIGSHLIPHLPRIPGIRQITLVDFDDYDDANLFSQHVTPRDVGKAKVQVQASYLKNFPHLSVRTIMNRVENVPLGQLRADVIMSCLDSRAARQFVNRFAWRLGIPWIDAAVEASELLARVNGYLPGKESPCLECAWEDRHYAAINTVYACRGNRKIASTNAPSALGALAASLQAVELERLLSGNREHAGRQFMINARHHTHTVTSFTRNPNCRFTHETWPIRPIGSPQEITLGDVFMLPTKNLSPKTSLALQGHFFANTLLCISCKHRVSAALCLCNSQSLRKRRRCACGGTFTATGFDLLERILFSDIQKNDLNRSLAAIGFRTGDVFTLTVSDDSSFADYHYELTQNKKDNHE